MTNRNRNPGLTSFPVRALGQNHIYILHRLRLSRQKTVVENVEPERSFSAVKCPHADGRYCLSHGRRRRARVGSGHVQRVDATRAGRHERHSRHLRIVGGDEVVGVTSRVRLDGVADVFDVTQLTRALKHAAARHQTSPGHVHRQHLQT